MGFSVTLKVYKIAEPMAGVFAGEEELLCRAGLIVFYAHFVGHEAVGISVDEEHGNAAAFHSLRRASGRDVKAAEYQPAQTDKGEEQLGIVLLAHDMADYLLRA